MFNERNKMKYLSDLVENERYAKGPEIITTYFNLSEPMEVALDKDIANFTLEEIVNYYKSICTTSELYLATINSQLAAYCDWNKAQGLSIDNQNHFKEIDRRILFDCINRNLFMSNYLTKSELYSYIQSGTFRNVSDELLLIAFFEGICGNAYDDLLNLSMKDIDEENKTVKLHNGKVLEVSDLFIKIAKDSADERVYHLANKDAYFDESDDHCFKMYRRGISEKNKKFVVIRRIKELKESYGCNAFGSKNLMESGRLDMIKTYMKEHNCDFAASMNDEEFKRKMVYRYGELQSIAGYYRNFKDLLERSD